MRGPYSLSWRCSLRVHEHRTVPRYFLTQPVGGTADGKPATLVDMSSKGVRLELSGPFTPGSTLHLDIVTPSGEIDGDATVLWCQIDELRLDGGDDRYLAGLVFVEQHPEIESIIDGLVNGGAAVLIEDFRSEDRYTITAPLTGSFGDMAPVSIIDLSPHGARVKLRSRISSGTGGALRFQVDAPTGPIDVLARTMWCAPSLEGGFTAGLKIEKTEEQIRTAIHRLCTRGEAQIDTLSLRRKFDAMRKSAPVKQARTA